MSQPQQPKEIATGQYDASAERWRAMWSRLAVDAGGDWHSPWLDETWRDGNPIFSAWSPRFRKGIRVLDHPDPGAFLCWEDSFGKAGAPEFVRELVVSCAATAANLRKVERMLNGWFGGSAEVYEDEPPMRIAS